MIYLDHASTTQVKSIAIAAIDECSFGNPNSIHDSGFEALKFLKQSEKLVKEQINGENGDLYWFSSASLINYFVINNVLKTGIYNPADFVCSSTTHKSIKNFAYKSKLVNSLKSGLISLDDLKLKINEDTRLFSLLYVNNETGVIQPVDQIKKYIKNSLYHLDAVQALTKIPIDVQKIDCDFLTLSGHKIGTPKGIACLWVKKDIAFHLPYLGTPPVPLIYSFAETLNFTNIHEKQKDINNKAKFFKFTLKEICALNNIEFEYTVQTENTVPNIISIRFLGLESSDILMSLNNEGIQVSAGSACNSTKIEPSYVLMAMGLSEDQALSTLRFSISENNTYSELKETVIKLVTIIKDINNE